MLQAKQTECKQKSGFRPGFLYGARGAGQGDFFQAGYLLSQARGQVLPGRTPSSRISFSFQKNRGNRPGRRADTCKETPDTVQLCSVIQSPLRKDF